MDDQILGYRRRLDTFPADREAFEALAYRYEKDADWADLVKVYETRIAALPDAVETAALRAQAARLYLERLSEPARAAEHLEHLVVSDPTQAEALDSLLRLREERSEWPQVLHLLLRRAEETTGPASADWRLKIGDVLHDRLGRTREAYAQYLLAIDADPERASAMKRARDLAVELQDWPKALELIDWEAEFAPGAGLAAEYLDLGRRLAEYPWMRDSARRCFEKARAGGDAETIEAALAALDEEARTWKDRARALRAEALDARDKHRAAELYLRIAQLHAIYDQDAGKVHENLDRAFTLAPGGTAALDFLERWLADDAAALAEALDRLAGTVKDRAAAGVILVRLAGLHAERNRDLAAAEKAWRRALELDPSNDAAAKALTAALAAKGAWSEAAEILEWHLSAVTDRAAQVHLRLGVARIHLRHLEGVERAREHLEAALGLEPDNLEAAAELEPLLRETGSWARLTEVLAIRLRGRLEPSERLRILDRLAETWAGPLGKPEEAARAATRALALEPGRRKSLKTLEEAAEAAGRPELLARGLATAGAVAEGDDRVELLLQLAKVHETALEDAVGAAEAYRALLSVAPGHAAATEGLERCLAAAGSDEELTLALERKVSEATDAPERRAARLKLARHHSERLSDDARAREIYESLVAEDPQDPEVLGRLAGVLERAGDHAALAEVIGRRLPLAEGKAALDLKLQLAELQARHLSREADAAALLCEILEADPARREALPLLEALLADGVETGRVAGLLEAHYAEAGDWTRHLDMLEQRLAHLSAPAERAEVLRRIASVQEERLVDRRQALAALARALLETPGDASIFEGLSRLAAETGAWSDLSQALERALTAGLETRRIDAEQALALREALADVRENRLGDLDGAVATWNEVLGQTEPNDPRHRAALLALARMAREGERWPELAGALRQIATLDGAAAERAEALLELGILALERLDDPAEAARVLRSALEAGAAEAGVLPTLSEALRRVGDPELLGGVLARRIALAETAGDEHEASRLRHEQAKLLGGSAEGITAWRDILAQRPTDPDALAALGAALEDPDLRVEAATALVQAYEGTQEHAGLVQSLEVLVEAAATPAEKTQLLRRVAAVQERDLRSPELALATLARSVAITPLDADLRSELRRLAAETGEGDVLLEVFDRAAEALTVDDARALRREAAEWAERRMNDRPEALRRLSALAAAIPGDVEVLEDLRSLQRQAEDWAGVATSCLALADATSDPDERIRLWREAGRTLEERAEDLEGAAAAHRRVLETDPSDAESARILERLYQHLGHAEDLAWVLQRARAQAGETDRGWELTYRQAEVLRTSLGRMEEALALYQALLAHDPAHTPTHQALGEIVRAGGPLAEQALGILDPQLQRLGAHRARVELREARLGRAQLEAIPLDRQAALFAELRGLHEHELQTPEMAFMMACRQLTAGVDAQTAMAEAERLARQAGTLDELCEVYEELATEVPEGDPRKLDLVRRVAALETEVGSDADRAIAAWKRVQQLAPEDRQVLDELEKLYNSRQDARDLVDIYRQKVDLSATPVERMEARLELARLHERTGALEQAIDAYEVLVGEAASAPDVARQALEQLDRLYTRAERWQDLGRVLASLVKHLADSQKRFRAMLRLGNLFEEHDAHPARALELYGAILDAFDSEAPPAEPDYAGAVEGLERLLGDESAQAKVAARLEPVYRRKDDVRKLIDVLEIRLAGLRDRTKRLALLQEIAGLYEARLGQKPLAFMVWCRAFREAAGDETIRERLERLATETDGWDELVGVYEDEITRLGGLAGTSAQREWVHRRLAGLYSQELTQLDKAISHQKRVCQLAPDDVDALETYSLLLRRGEGDPAELARVYRRLVSMMDTPERRKDLWMEIGRLEEEVLGDRAAAVDALREVLALDPEEPDRDVLPRLQRLFADLERWDDLASALDQEAELALGRSDAGSAAHALHQMGRVRQVRQEDLLAAVEAYARALQAEPRHGPSWSSLEEVLTLASGAQGPGREAAGKAAALLEARYAERGDTTRRIVALEALAAAADEPTERADRLMAVAELYDSEQQSAEMAFMAASRALQIDPSRLDILARLRAFSEAAELQDSEADLLGELLPELRQDEVKAAWQRRLGAIQADAGETEAAVAHYRALLDLVPGDAEALDRLARLTRLEGDHGALLEVLQSQLALAEDDAQSVRLLRQIGAIQDEHLDDAAGALTTLRRILESVPDDRETLTRVDGLCVKLERWTELEETLAREAGVAAQATDVAAQVGFLYRLAVLREEHLHDPAGALDTYREILRLNPGHEDTVARLEEILETDTRRLDVARMVEDVYRDQERWSQLLSMLELRASQSAERDERLAVLWEMHEIQEQRLDSPDMAFIVLCRAFNEHPADSRARADLERLADLTEQHEELVAIFEDAMDEIGSPEVIAEMSLTVARAYEERLGQADEAVPHYERTLQNDPENLKALQALDRLYRKQERWSDLADVLEREAACADVDDEQAAVLFRLGQLCIERLDAPDRAVGVYERLLELSPGHLPALRALEQLYEQAGAWEELARNLEVQLERSKDQATWERLTGRLADVLGRHLDEHERAIGLWTEILEKNRRSDAALSALEDLYEDTEQWTDLADLLRRRLDMTVDPREITRLNDRLGWVLGTHLGEATEAIGSFKAVLERDPRNVRALESLRDIYAAAGEWDELVTVLKRLVPLQEGPADVKKVRFRLAEVLGRELGRRDEAVEATRRFLDNEPHTPEELEPLEALLRELGALSEAVAVMELRARALAAQHEQATAALEGVDDPLAEEHAEALRKARITLLFAIAAAHADDLHKVEGGATALEEVLGVDPGNRESYEALRGIYENASRWRDLATLLERFLPHAADAEERKALLLESAGLQEVRLGQKDLAFMAMGRAISEDPEDPALEEALVRLAGESDSWDELAMVLEEVAENVGAGPRKEALYLRLAEVHDTRLDDSDEAEAAIRKILAFDPGSKKALEALADLFVRRGEARQLVVALEQKLEATGDPDEQKQVLARIAQVFENEIEDLEEAIGTWRRILDLDGGDATAIENLARIFEAHGRWEDLVGSLRRAVDAADEPETRAGLEHRIGVLWEERLSEDDQAIACYRAAAEHVPTHAPSLEALERIYTRLERWSELLQTYEAEVQAASEADEKVRVLLKIAALHEGEFDNGINAIGAFDRALEIEPDNLGALRSLARLLRQEEDWDRLIAVLDKQITLCHEMDEAVRLHLELGEIWHAQLGRADKADTIFNHALEIDPESRAALNALGRLYEQSGNWNLALEMMQRDAKLAGLGDDAVELQYRMGRIHEDMLLDRAAAKSCYEQALDVEPAHLPSIQALKSLAEAGEDWDGYLQALVQEARHTPDLPGKTRLLHQIGVFHRDRREDPESALRYFEEALQKTEDDLEAAQDAAALHLAAEGWERAEALLCIACDKHEERGTDAKELCRHWYKLGYTRDKLGRTEQAVEAFRRAYEHDATYLPALEGLGAGLVATRRWEEALKIYQAILIHHRDSVTDLEVVEYYWQLAEINGQIGHRDRAVRNYEKALEIDAAHEPSLGGLIRLLEEAAEWEDALEHRQRLLDVLEDEPKYEMYLAVGQLAREKLEDPYQGIDSYLGAHRMRPDRVAPMESLLVLYRETRQSAKASEMLERLLAHPEIQADKGKARRYHYSLAEVLRDDLKDTEGALLHFDAALDVDYTFGQAFVALEELLTRGQRYEDLEQAYVRMIQRIPKTPQTHAVRMGLWKTLGELYRQVLRNLEGALFAYQVVCKGDKEDIEAIETYAALLAQKPGAEAQAVQAFHEALKVTTEPVRVARALLRLYSAQKSYDKAYAVSAVITHLLQDAQEDEQRFYEKLKPHAKKNAKRVMTDRLWEQKLYHEKLKGPVADILAILYEQAGGELAVDSKDLGINPKRDRVDPMTGFANAHKYVGGVLGMMEVPLYRSATQTEGLAVANTFPVSLVANDEMLGRSRMKELRFHVAKALAFTRPELALGRLHSLEDLDLLIQAAASLVNPAFPVTLDPKEVGRVQRKLQRALSPEALEALSRVVRGWRPDRTLADLRTYAEGVEHTANRAGILLCDDVEVARACLMEDRGGAAKLRRQSKVRELVMFCLAEEYFELRDALSLALEIGS